MAQMIPDEMPPGKSIGECKLFGVLQGLPDDCIVYWEPGIRGTFPDFVVIMPACGVLIIEVKGWWARQIVGGDSHKILLRMKPGSEPSAEKHPLRQGRDYMYTLMDECERSVTYRTLVHGSGPRKGKLLFPFGHCAVMTQISEEEMASHQSGDLRTIFPAGQVVCADEFDQWSAFTRQQIHARLASLFDKRWDFPALTEAQVNSLRTVIHPEVLVPPSPAQLAALREFSQQALAGIEEQSLKTLDLDQERVARKIGSGHRLLFGVAGSGKTVALLARARFLSEALPAGRVLVLCFNVALMSYLKASLEDRPNVTVFHFHGWGRHIGVTYEDDAAQYGAAVLAVLERDGDAGAYDAVLIDEAQDFDASWFRCARLALKEPHGGDLLIVGDRNQTNYRRRKQTWVSLGISAQGRSTILRDNYRNTRQILEAAQPFGENADDEEGIAAAVVDPAQCRRSGAVRPLLLRCHSRADEIQAVRLIASRLVAGKFGHGLEALPPSEIGVLYRRYGGLDREAVEEVRSVLETLAPVISIRGSDPDSRLRVLEPGIKLQTIHSAKGLQYRAVILTFADQLGRDPDRLDDDRSLLYVALTRPEDVLVVTCTTGPRDRPSPLLEELLASKAFDRSLPPGV